jgi:hypothetical protein
LNGIGLNDFESDVDSSVTFETSCISDEYPNQTKQPIQPTSKTTSERLVYNKNREKGVYEWSCVVCMRK